jgi:hypothetical protein
MKEASMAEDDVAGHAQVGQWFRTHLYSRPPLDSPKRGYGDYLLQLHGVAEANFKAHQFMAAHIERWHRRVLLVAAALGFVATSAAAASTVSRVVIFVAAATNTVLLAATARVVSIERARAIAKTPPRGCGLATRLTPPASP